MNQGVTLLLFLLCMVIAFALYREYANQNKYKMLNVVQVQPEMVDMGTQMQLPSNTSFEYAGIAAALTPPTLTPPLMPPPLMPPPLSGTMAPPPIIGGGAPPPPAPPMPPPVYKPRTLDTTKLKKKGDMKGIVFTKKPEGGEDMMKELMDRLKARQGNDGVVLETNA